jgi:hypothetical protein
MSAEINFDLASTDSVATSGAGGHDLLLEQGSDFIRTVKFMTTPSMYINDGAIQARVPLWNPETSEPIVDSTGKVMWGFLALEKDGTPKFDPLFRAYVIDPGAPVSEPVPVDKTGLVWTMRISLPNGARPFYLGDGGIVGGIDGAVSIYIPATVSGAWRLKPSRFINGFGYCDCTYQINSVGQGGSTEEEMIGSLVIKLKI